MVLCGGFSAEVRAKKMRQDDGAEFISDSIRLLHEVFTLRAAAFLSLLSLCSKYELDEEHIDCRSAADGEEHLTEFQMQERRDGDGNPLRQAVRPAEERHILQAVNDEHSEDGGGEDVAKVANERRCRLFSERRRKGSARVSTLASAQSPIVMHCSVKLMPFPSSR